MWTEVGFAVVFGCVLVSMIGCFLVATGRIDSRVKPYPSTPAKFGSWIVLVCGLLGWFVWGPTLVWLVGFPWAFVAFPLGIFPGLFFGYCTARLVTPLVFTELAGDPDQEVNDALD